MRILGTVASSSREVPGAPTIGTATNVGSGRAYNNGRADITFTAPAFNGGLPITSYTVTSSPGGFTASGASSPLTVTGLQSATAYTFTVTATNSRGTGPASAASNSITATTVPQAPTIGTATATTSTAATVAYTTGATGGAAISTFTATSSPGSLTGTGASPITVSGLTSGTAYTFTVTATNANGTSTASAASNSVTPSVPGVYNSIATTNVAGQSTVTISSIPTTYKHLVLRWSFRGSGSNIVTFTRINGLTTTVYINNNAIWLNDNTQSNVTTPYVPVNSMIGGRLSGTYSTGNVMYFPNYSSTTLKKTNLSYFGGGSDGYINGAGIQAAFVDTASAITSITVATQSGTMQGTNASISLYGIE